MKKTILNMFILVTLCFTGCSVDDGTVFFYESVPIESVEVPDTFTRGETVELIVSFFRPSDCHSFFNFDYKASDNQRIVTAINVVIDNGSSCTSLDQKDTVDIPLRFQARDADVDSYVFKFWQGKDDQDEDQFLEIEVPVIE